MKVLVIDDDTVFAEALLWRLKTEGYEVTYCESVEDVLDGSGELRVPRPDCILLDIMMPRGSRYSKHETEAGKRTGLKLLEDLQKKKLNISIIVITVRNNLSLHELQEKYGDNIKVILVKPATPTQVITEIKILFPQAS